MPRKDTQFKAGQSGNPEGRPQGLKNHFSKQLKDDLRAAYEARGKGEKGGKSFWREIKREHPVIFARILAGLLPKELDLNLNTEAIEQAAAIARQMDRITAPGQGNCTDDALNGET